MEVLFPVPFLNFLHHSIIERSFSFGRVIIWKYSEASYWLTTEYGDYSGSLLKNRMSVKLFIRQALEK